MTPYTYAYDKRVLDSESLNTGGFKGGQGGHAPQDARGDEVTLSTKDFSVQFCSCTQNVQFKVVCSLQS